MWAKSCDQEIVRAQKKCPKAVPTHFQNHLMWSHAPKCNVKSCDRAFNQMLLQGYSIQLEFQAAKKGIKGRLSRNNTPTSISKELTIVCGGLGGFEWCGGKLARNGNSVGGPLTSRKDKKLHLKMELPCQQLDSWYDIFLPTPRVPQIPLWPNKL